MFGERPGLPWYEWSSFSDKFHPTDSMNQCFHWSNGDPGDRPTGTGVSRHRGKRLCRCETHRRTPPKGCGDAACRPIEPLNPSAGSHPRALAGQPSDRVRARASRPRDLVWCDRSTETRPEVRCFEGDITREQDVLAAMAGVQCVFHMASFGMSGLEQVHATATRAQGLRSRQQDSSNHRRLPRLTTSTR